MVVGFKSDKELDEDSDMRDVEVVDGKLLGINEVRR